MSRTRKFMAALLALSALSFSACEDSPSAAGNGSISILLTDAPAANIDSAVVRITEISMAGTRANGEPVILRDDPVVQDLLELDNDVLTLVEDLSLPAGTYSQLRFAVSDACIVVKENGETTTYASQDFAECGMADGTLIVPSYAETGVKVNLPNGAVRIEGEQEILLADFDVSESFGVQAGMSGMWTMTPVLTATDFDLTTGIAVSATLADGVTLPDPDNDGTPVTLGDFTVSVRPVAGGDASSADLGDPNGDGTYEASITLLDPADSPFEVELQAPGVTITTDPVMPVEVDVASAEQATVAFIITEASS